MTIALPLQSSKQRHATKKGIMMEARAYYTNRPQKWAFLSVLHYPFIGSKTISLLCRAMGFYPKVCCLLAIFCYVTQAQVNKITARSNAFANSANR
jgi:hypothetical protein